MNIEKELNDLEDMPISLPWKGYGSSVFLELGKLSSPSNHKRSKYENGEACVSIDWDWRVEKGKEILFGSSGSNQIIHKGIQSLINTRIKTIELQGNVPELNILLSNGYIIRTMAMVKGGPEWAIKTRSGKWVSCENGVLGFEADRPELTSQEKEIFELAEAAAQRWGVPEENLKPGECVECKYYAPIDGNGHLLDYGVCSSVRSVYDGQVVNIKSGCSKYSEQTET